MTKYWDRCQEKMVTNVDMGRLKRNINLFLGKLEGLTTYPCFVSGPKCMVL